MKTAFFSINPLWKTFDRGESRDAFAGRQVGINHSSGKEEEFEYGAVVEAPYYASDEEVDALM